jgi:hypothetical protein
MTKKRANPPSPGRPDASAVGQQLARLTARGLKVEAWREYGWATDKEFQFRIEKPTGVRGNSIPDVDVWMGFKSHDDRKSDAPRLWLFADGANWVVLLHDYVPGPGPGDFRHVHARLEDAVGDVWDYYFGDPARMQARWRAAGLG